MIRPRCQKCKRPGAGKQRPKLAPLTQSRRQCLCCGSIWRKCKCGNARLRKGCVGFPAAALCGTGEAGAPALASCFFAASRVSWRSRWRGNGTRLVTPTAFHALHNGLQVKSLPRRWGLFQRMETTERTKSFLICKVVSFRQRFPSRCSLFASGKPCGPLQFSASACGLWPKFK